MEETLDILSTPGALDEIKKAQAEIDAGLGFSGEDMQTKYSSR
jgi:hypothetical protein